MFRVKDYGLIFIPASTAWAADSALFVSGAGNFCRVASNARHGNTSAFSRARRQWAIHHISRKPNRQVVGKAAMLENVGIDYGIFPSRNPVPNIGGFLTYGNDIFQMRQRLNVAAVVPAEHVHASLRDLKCHGFHPFGMGETFKTALQCSLDIAENVTPFEGVTFRADGTRNGAELAADNAGLSRNAIRKAWHLRRFRKPASDLFRNLWCHRFLD